MTQAAKLAQIGSPGVSTGFKNRIINGAMMIDQRNAGASVTPTTDGQYTLDRFKARLSQASKFSVQQNAGSVTPPAGFNNYLGITSLSSYSSLAGDYFGLVQNIEGYNTADWSFGTANACSITMSFWVRSSLTGQFSGVVYNDGNTRNYNFIYTINSANTWEQKSVTIPGDTGGTWLTNNGSGLQVWWDLGTGSTYTGSAQVWTSSNLPRVTGSVSIVGTNGATFYITGVQLEVGTTATDFEYVDYGRQLIQCQRYAQPFGQGSVGRVYSATEVEMSNMFRVTMRSAPTVTFGGFSGASTAVSQNPNSQMVATAVSTAGIAKTTGTYALYTVTGGVTGAIATVWSGDTCFASAEL